MQKQHLENIDWKKGDSDAVKEVERCLLKEKEGCRRAKKDSEKAKHNITNLNNYGDVWKEKKIERWQSMEKEEQIKNLERLRF